MFYFPAKAYVSAATNVCVCVCVCTLHTIAIGARVPICMIELHTYIQIPIHSAGCCWRLMGGLLLVRLGARCAEGRCDGVSRFCQMRKKSHKIEVEGKVLLVASMNVCIYVQGYAVSVDRRTPEDEKSRAYTHTHTYDEKKGWVLCDTRCLRM